MNIFAISWKNFRREFLKKSLNIILIAFGIIIINTILVASHQLERRLDAHAGKVDLVVGAKGSPMQLILSNIYHADFPTGNIPLEAANELIQHPYVKLSAPLSIGDSYRGYRIVGTNDSFLKLFNLTVGQGGFFTEEFDAVVGYQAAAELGLSLGSTFTSEHGLSEGGTHHHHGHYFKVVGILEASGTVSDNLILTSLETVWHVHDMEGPEEELEITSLLIKYQTPLAIAVFPAMVNQYQGLQAASPALETARLFSLISSAFDIIKAFGILIIVLAAFSVFMVLYTSLSERKMDIALMRSMGASRAKVFSLMALEGFIITLIGTLLGIAISHLLIEIAGEALPARQATGLTGFVFIPEELAVLGLGLITGLVASLIPALAAYRTNISSVLARG
jgi:putative ABC transport system permease protein